MKAAVDMKTSGKTAVKEKKPPRQKKAKKVAKERGIGWRRELSLTILAATAPLIVISGVLLLLVFANRVIQSTPVSQTLTLPEDTEDKNAYLVDYSATRLTTLASWASSIATLTPGLLVSLCTYQVAKRVLQNSNPTNSDKLPSPYQLSLLLGTYNGGLLSLWNWIKYMTRRKREKAIPVLHFTLFFFGVSTVLSLAIWGADTWFHVSTTTILLSKIMDPSIRPGSYTYSWGTGISPDCQNFSETYPLGDYSQDCANNFYFEPARMNDGYHVLNNVSDTHQLVTLYDSAYGNDTSFIISSEVDLHTDYKTNSIGFSASCKPTSRACGLRLYTDHTSTTINNAGLFNCSDGFSGLLPGSDRSFGSYYGCHSYGGGCFGLFPNSSYPLTGNYTSENIYVGLAAQIIGIADKSLGFDPEVLSVYDYSDIVLACEVRVSEVTFSRLNGTMTLHSSVAANNSVVMMSMGWALFGIANPAIANLVQLAAVTSETSEELANNFATSVGKLFASFSADSFVSRWNDEDQSRRTILVARVPKAPLIVLVVLCLLLSLLGLILMVVVLGSQPGRLRDVQARLSIAGVVAGYFESTERISRKVTGLDELFDEKNGPGHSNRVGMVPTQDGGWVYKIFPTSVHDNLLDHPQDDEHQSDENLPQSQEDDRDQPEAPSAPQGTDPGRD